MVLRREEGGEREVRGVEGDKDETVLVGVGDAGGELPRHLRSLIQCLY